MKNPLDYVIVCEMMGKGWEKRGKSGGHLQFRLLPVPGSGTVERPEEETVLRRKADKPPARRGD